MPGKSVIIARLLMLLCLFAVAPASARQGCGTGNHRGRNGLCYPDRPSFDFNATHECVPGVEPGKTVCGPFFRDKQGRCVGGLGDRVDPRLCWSPSG